jgi:signal transduction histidine kinase
VTDRLALTLHELRSPVAALTAIAAAFSERRRAIGQDDALTLLRLAAAAARDVERIVLDATPGALRRERVDTALLVVDVARAAGLGGRTISVHAEGDLPPLDADPVRLRQALANLVENAAAHSPAETPIVVSASCARDGVRIAVADEGEGIPEERLEAILEPGVRFAERPGQGIGLAVARAVAEAHGGRLEVTSAPGRGATFTLVLPPAADAPA